MSERVPHEVHSVEDLHRAIGANGAAGSKLRPLKDFMNVKTPRPSMLIEDFLPSAGVIRLEAPQKTGKTPLSLQIAMCVATGKPLFDWFRVLKPGSAIYVEKDDPGGVGVIQDIIEKTSLPIHEAPFFPVAGDDVKDLELGPEFLDWLDREMAAVKARLVVLDSYTALRPMRQGRGDIVKMESEDIALLDSLSKKHDALILLLHHYSKGSAKLDWSEQGGGSFGMGQASEGQIAMTRFDEMDLDSNACERLVRVRGRHFPSTDIVLRLDPGTMTWSYVMHGLASKHYPEIVWLRDMFGQATFAPKQVAQETGMARTTIWRLLKKLVRADVLTKKHGEYRLKVNL